MEAFKGACPHLSVPVETDESMTSTWPSSCHQCSVSRGNRKTSGEEDPVPVRETPGRADQESCPGGSWGQLSPSVGVNQEVKAMASCHRGYDSSMHPTAYPPGGLRPPLPVGLCPHGCRERAGHDEDPAVGPALGRGYTDSWNEPQENSAEGLESLEPPLPLLSNSSRRCPEHVADHTHDSAPGNRMCVCEPVARDERSAGNSSNYPQNHRGEVRHPHDSPYWQDQCGDRSPDIHLARCMAPLRELMGEVRISTPCLAAPRTGTQEIRRTISLPEECRNLFITYSVDTALEMFPFTKFLINQGFKPAIDIFDNPVRRMDITKWMDSYLNNKSVLIIVVISPKYKADVEGEGDDDDHGLHTKYIHNQIQNEFIRQRCLNFRLVPVLFRSATKKHVPTWLQSTRIYRWPEDIQDLLLRLLREERYIAPSLGRAMTLTVRPL